MNFRDTFRLALGVVSCCWAGAALADEGRVTAFVERTMVTGDELFGGCMAFLSEDVAAVLPACKNSWVTFSCDGTYTDPVRAYRMLDQAQLALATGMKVIVIAEDTMMHNGYCFAKRINVQNP